jgi:hypothetical protein
MRLRTVLYMGEYVRNQMFSELIIFFITARSKALSQHNCIFHIHSSLFEFRRSRYALKFYFSDQALYSENILYKIIEMRLYTIIIMSALRN